MSKDKQRYELLLNLIEESHELALEARHEGYKDIADIYLGEVRRFRAEALAVQERLARAFIRSQQ